VRHPGLGEQRAEVHHSEATDPIRPPD
jgi:hypothetical protein